MSHREWVIALVALVWGMGSGITLWEARRFTQSKEFADRHKYDDNTPPRVAYVLGVVILFVGWIGAFVIWMFQPPGTAEDKK